MICCEIVDNVVNNSNDLIKIIDKRNKQRLAHINGTKIRRKKKRKNAIDK